MNVFDEFSPETTRRRALGLLAGAAFGSSPVTSLAQTAPGENPGLYPNRPIRMILGGSAGGSTDVVTRLVTQKLSDQWGQPFVVENMPGANGAIATETVARAAPNGYTLYTISSSAVVTYAFAPKTARSIDLLTAFTPVTLMVLQPYVMVVNAALPVSTVAELVAYAKARPGQLNYGSLGIGSASHLGMELFNSLAGISMVHVPYRGTNQVEPDIAAGHIQVLLGGAASAMPMVKTGKTRALAVTSAVRSKLLPGLPTVAEANFPGFSLDAWFGILAPAGTPAAVLTKIHTDAARVLNSAEIRDRLAASGSEVASSETPAAFGKFISAEIDKWDKFGRSSNIKL